MVPRLREEFLSKGGLIEEFDEELATRRVCNFFESQPPVFWDQIAINESASLDDVAQDIADSLEEAGERLFTFTRLPPSQWRSVRTTNAIERLHEEFKRRIKTQTVLPSADTAAMLFWALLASGQINMRKVDGWQTLSTKPIDQPIDLAA